MTILASFILLSKIRLDDTDFLSEIMIQNDTKYLYQSDS
jgi:hypothetical protein